MNFEVEQKQKIETIDGFLREALRPQKPEVIYEAMAYSVFAGGKRLRPLLALGVCDALGGREEDLLPFACAIEMIHTYSLIHDDLPDMDDDDLRRGKPTNHKVFGAGMAILAGDGLLNLAFETMARACLEQGGNAPVAAMLDIGTAAGVKGMIGGQTADILSENKNVEESELLYIHEHKTAKLISAAFSAGAILSTEDGAVRAACKKAGETLGLAFQIKDDILDFTGDTKELGKPVKSDEKNQKSTYVSLYGLERSKKMYNEMSGEAMALLQRMGGENGFLIELCRRLVDRTH